MKNMLPLPSRANVFKNNCKGVLIVLGVSAYISSLARLALASPESVRNTMV